MAKIRVTKEFRFEGAHALKNYDGKCKHIHGHSYILLVTIKGEPINDRESPKNGMVIDFSILKQIVNDNIIDKLDHALLLRNDSPLIAEISESYCNVVVTDFQPTCENLAVYIATIIKNSLPENISLHSIRLYETATSYVEWFAQDN